MVSEIESIGKKLAALNRFLSKSAKTTEANKTFQRMKECLESLTTMVIPTKGETLIVYLAASKRNVSAVLMAERGKKQAPVYFVSRTLYEAKQKYPELEKLILALV
ncbi:reverse transcriptase domain-containing protein, partial [Tanacetum coccineum]